MTPQYPYILFFYQPGSPGGQDVSGNWIPQSEGQWIEAGKCRDSATSKGSSEQMTDGIANLYDFLIQMPPKTTIVPVGTKIRVKQGDVIRMEGNVQRLYVGQLHTKVWV